MAKASVYIRPFVVAIALLGAVTGLSACNTMEGAGEDIEKAGEKIQESAQ